MSDQSDDGWLAAIESGTAQDGPIDDAATLEKLATLEPLAYDRARVDAAEALGVSVGALDRAVRAVQRRGEAQDKVDPFSDVEPAAKSVKGASLLDEIRATICRFCVMPDHAADLAAAWVVHAWCHDAADISPLLVLTSPEKRCGKTTALSAIGALVPRPAHAVNISTAVVFRVVEAYRPTLLVDEADTFLAASDELRGVLNGGHNRLSAYVWRIEGEEREPRRFNVWAPKAIALIGSAPDTLEDRAILVRLRRKAGDETVDRFRASMVQDLEPLRARCSRLRILRAGNGRRGCAKRSWPTRHLPPTMSRKVPGRCCCAIFTTSSRIGGLSDLDPMIWSAD